MSKAGADAAGRWLTRLRSVEASHPLAAAVVVALVVSIGTWSVALAAPIGGLDGSWQTALVAGFEHLRFGSNVVFTYGPFGFLTLGTFVSGVTAVSTLLYLFLVRVLFALLLFSALRGRTSFGVRLVLVWLSVAVCANLVDGGDLILAPALLLAVRVARPSDVDSVRRSRLLFACLGCLGGLALLEKFSGGAIILAMLVVASVSYLPDVSRIAVGLGSSVLTFLLLWIAADQQLGAVGSYLHGSLSASVDYAAAMNIHDPARGSENWYAVAVLLGLVHLVVHYVWGRRGVVCVATVLVVLGWTWGAVKEGFVRHDAHDLVFFGLSVVLVSALASGLFMARQLMVVFVASIVALTAAGSVPASLADPVSSVKLLVNDVRTAASSQRRTAALDRSRALLQASATDGLPKHILALIGDASVAAYPTEVGLSWTYPQLRWRFVPVLQGYSAYSPYLDDLDASYLQSPRAPKYLVYQSSTIDGRDAAFDPPQATLALLCGYRSLYKTQVWQLLVKGPDRCGAPVPVRSVAVKLGQMVDVPQPGRDEVVTAEISVDAPVRAKVEGLLLKPPPVYVDLRDQAGSGTYRFVAATGPDPHVVGAGPGVGRLPVTLSGVPTTQMSFSGGGWPDGGGKVEVRFFELAIKPR